MAPDSLISSPSMPSRMPPAMPGSNTTSMYGRVVNWFRLTIEPLNGLASFAVGTGGGAGTVAAAAIPDGAAPKKIRKNSASATLPTPRMLRKPSLTNRTSTVWNGSGSAASLNEPV
jgi:hypothetical protein